MTTTVGSGLGSSLGSAPEVSYGKFVTPTRSLEYGNHNIAWKPKRSVGSGLANGLLVQRAAQRVQTTSAVAGDVKTQGFYKGLGQWFGGLMGSLGVAPAQQGGTTAYQQVHALGNNFGQSLSLQAGISQLGGLVVPRNWAGVKTTKGVFECKVDGVLNCTFSVDGRSEDTAAGRADAAGTTLTNPTVTDVSITLHDLGAPVSGTGIPAASYVGLPLIPGVSFTLSSSPVTQTNVNATATGTPTLTVGTAYGAPSYQSANNVFSFANAQFKLGAFGSEVVVEGVRGVTLTIERPMKVDNFYQDGWGMKQEPQQNGFVKIGVSLETDYLSDPAFVGQFVADTAQSMIWSFTSTVNAGAGFPYSLSFAVPNLNWDDGAPTVDGPDVVKPKMTLTGLVDSSAHTAATITAMSTDTTL
jgi:hypothetical protein